MPHESCSVRTSHEITPFIGREKRSIALVGNPNTGKTALFNTLTGLRHRVANYPGITVEKRWGEARYRNLVFDILDLPGTYSLDAESQEEKVVYDVLFGRQEGTGKPDLLIVIADPFHLERSLYLVSQLLDLRAPIVLALNYRDEAERRKLHVDAALLEKRLGLPVAFISAREHVGIPELWGKIVSSLSVTRQEGALLEVASALEEAKRRYAWVETTMKGVVTFPDQNKDIRERLDQIFLHPVLGFLIFFAVTFFIFQSIFTWAQIPMLWIEKGIGLLGLRLSPLLPQEVLRSFLIDGVLAGVGSVVMFLPQILILFFFIGVLEDTGYLARAAFLLDKIMAKVGLNGKSFLPLFSCFACAIPGIIATRTIENRKERLATILIAPLMTCSARLPIYTMITAALIPSVTVFGIFNLQGIVFVSMYFLGMAVAVAMSLIFKRTLPSKGRSHFFMELPPYRVPHWKSIFLSMRDRARIFLRMAGSVILVLSVFLWAAVSFPRPVSIAAEFAKKRIHVIQTTSSQEIRTAALAAVGREEKSRYLEESVAGKVGHWVEPLLRPLGFDWKIGLGLIASFAQREVFVSTLAIVYKVGATGTQDLQHILQCTYTPLMGLSVLVFYALACQCMSTVAIVRRETGGWHWPFFMMTYMTLLAYGASWVVFQGGRLLGFR